jgi:hypothetical protein
MLCQDLSMTACVSNKLAEINLLAEIKFMSLAYYLHDNI